MQAEVCEVRQDFAAPLGVKDAQRIEAPNDIGDLDVEEVRRVKRLRIEQTAFDESRIGSP